MNGAAVRAAPGPRGSASRPNIVLIVLDTARADAFEPYGAPRDSTPTVAQLASSGVAVGSAIAPGSWTLPSHVGMFTGQPARAVGLGHAPGGTAPGCRPRMEALTNQLLPEVLRRNGYATLGVSANGWIRAAAGFDIGFDEFVQVTHRHAPPFGKGPMSELRWAWYGLRAPHDDGAAEAGDHLRRWLRQRPPGPFFWFVNLVECHSPYLPPRAQCALGPTQRMRAGVEACRHLSLSSLWRASAGGFDVPEPALARMRHLYARAIHVMDDWLDRLVSALHEEQLLEDTMLIVTSDHGENFGEGGLMGHCFSLDQRLIHVPLVISGPGTPAVDGAVGLTALPRMIAAAAGIDDHPWDGGGKGLPDGVAVSQFDGLVPAGDTRAREAATSWGLDADAAATISDQLTAATDGDLKLLRNRRGDHLFDLRVDPLERHPIDPSSAAPADHTAVERLRRALGVAAEEAPAMPEVEPVPMVDREREELEQQMRLLGYM